MWMNLWCCEYIKELGGSLQEGNERGKVKKRGDTLIN